VSGETCHQGTTPPYGIAISSAQDASDVVNWATTHSVKLTIKNTGAIQFGISYTSCPFTSCHKVMTTSVVPRDLLPFKSSPTISAVSRMSQISSLRDRRLYQSRPLRLGLERSWKPVSLDSCSPTPLLTASFSLPHCGGTQCFGRIGRLSDCWRWYVAHILFSLTIAYSALDQRAVLSRQGDTVCECAKSPNVMSFFTHLYIKSDSVRPMGLL
jgi:hypothetical protein